METYTVYVVQYWVERYDYWSDSVVPSESMFGLPTVSYETEDEGRARLNEMTSKYPGGQYRLIRRTTTQEVI